MKNNDLVVFLSEIIDSIKEEKISEDQFRFVGEFLMKYKYHEELDNVDTEEDVKKYLFLGWYIYTQILKK